MWVVKRQFCSPRSFSRCDAVEGALATSPRLALICLGIACAIAFRERHELLRGSPRCRNTDAPPRDSRFHGRARLPDSTTSRIASLWAARVNGAPTAICRRYSRGPRLSRSCSRNDAVHESHTFCLRRRSSTRPVRSNISEAVAEPTIRTSRSTAINVDRPDPAGAPEWRAARPRRRQSECRRTRRQRHAAAVAESIDHRDDRFGY